jgi:hypothetical protein
VIRLPTGLAPGGLVFVLYDGADVEIDRVPVVPGVEVNAYVADMAERHAELMMQRGGTMRVFDGDTGRIVSELHVD